MTDLAHPGELAGGALRTFFSIADHWGLSDGDCQALLAVSQLTLHRWRNDPSGACLCQAQLERLSCLFNIWANLQTVLPAEQAADSWIMRPNDSPLFGGHAPLERLRSPDMTDMYTVLQYTSAWRELKS